MMPGLILTHLPADILLGIISFLSPLDIIRLRQVSQTLFALTHEAVVWIRAHESSRLPRPPGPYACPDDKEVSQLLERTLVQSAKFKPWSARRLHHSPHHKLGNAGKRNQRHFSQWGRWFITTMGSSVIYCNIDSDDQKTHILFRLDDTSTSFRLFQCVDTVNLAGHPVTYVLVRGNSEGSLLTLLKIVDHSCPSLLVESATSFSFPGYDGVKFFTASPRYLCMSGFKQEKVILALVDVTTGKVYHLPLFVSGLAPERHVFGGHSVNCILTDTHVLLTLDKNPLNMRLWDPRDPDLLVQAYPLPAPKGTANDDGILRMTHEGVCKIFGAPKWVLRANETTTTNDTTSTQIRLMNTFDSDSDTVTFSAIDLTLSSPSSPTGNIGIIQHTQPTRLCTFPGYVILAQIAMSQDGFGRGILYYEDSDDLQLIVRTFSVDASGPICLLRRGRRRFLGHTGPSDCALDVWNGLVYLRWGQGEYLGVHGFRPWGSLSSAGELSGMGLVQEELEPEWAEDEWEKDDPSGADLTRR